MTDKKLFLIFAALYWIGALAWIWHLSDGEAVYIIVFSGPAALIFLPAVEVAMRLLVPVARAFFRALSSRGNHM